MLRRLLLSDSSISLLLHGLKCVVALAVNWIVLAQFPSADYVSWAVSSSILVVATASDLGIGQYATTQYIHASRDRWPAIAKESVVALAPLALFAIGFVYLALGDQPSLYKVAMAVFIAVRVLSIPFGAALNAVNQFKIRKAIELGVYVVAAALIALVAYAEGAVTWALLGFNASFTVGGILTVKFAARFFEVRHLWTTLPSLANLRIVYLSSVPYMANNLTGLLTYGGFIWISSFVLTTEALAKLSVLHTFILINTYQAYDVILRSRQADFVRSDHVKRMTALNFVLMALCPLVALSFGSSILSFITGALSFSQGEILMFALFISIELGFLLIQSVVQVNPRLANLLSQMSLIKLVCQAAAVMAFWLMASSKGDLIEYVSLLTATSLLGYVVCVLRLRSSIRSQGGEY